VSTPTSPARGSTGVNRPFRVSVARPLLAAGMMWPLAACSAAETPLAQLAVRDSAGVEILESDGVPVESWRLAQTPDLVLGAGEGDELFRVRGAARLSDGRIVVSNGGTHEIRMYAADGRFLHTVGGAGGGPGEFSMLGAVEVAGGDTLVAFDPLAGRVSYFDPGGRFVRSLRVEPSPGVSPVVTPVGVLAAGVIVARGRFEAADALAPSEGSHTTTERANEGVLLFEPDGRVRAIVGPFAGSETTRQVSSDGGRSFSIRSVPVPFQRALRAAARGGTIVVGSTERYEFRIYDPDGELRRIVREHRRPRRVTAADFDAWIAERGGGEPGSAAHRAMQARYAGIPLPTALPEFDALHLDALGGVWVREHGAADAAGAVRWRVFQPHRRRLAELSMPAALRPFEIGDGFVLGLWIDELGVEHVRLYRYEGPTGA
jgi:hypothetical protein